MKKEHLKDKVIVLTGASSGFGKGAALEFAKAGAKLVLAARRSELLESLAKQCQEQGAQALAVPTDVSVQAEMRQLAEQALARFGRIDVWINNAGVGAIGPFEKIPLADHIQVIETNLSGTLYGSFFAYQQFLKQKAGILINISSELGKHSVPYYTSYTAAKHGIVGLSESLRQEIDQNHLEDIHVCVVLPTAHDTPFFDHVANYSGHEVQAPKPLHDPENVIETLVSLVQNPKDQKIVGGDGVVKLLLKNIVPKLAEKMGAKQMHETQMEKAPPAAYSPGAVRTPMLEGTGVEAGRREH